MRRTVLVVLAVLAILCIAGLATAAVANQRAKRDCAQADNPERCQHNQRLRAYCAEHPDDAQHCVKHQAARHDMTAERHRAYCREHPDDAQHCAKRTDARPAA